MLVCNGKNCTAAAPIMIGGSTFKLLERVNSLHELLRFKLFAFLCCVRWVMVGHGSSSVPVSSFLCCLRATRDPFGLVWQPRDETFVISRE